jgi:DNA-binding Lrp family transcriptional regulator
VDSLTLDDLDRRLLHALQLDGRAPFSRIAEVLGVSDRTLARRYRRLRSRQAMRVVGLPDGRLLGELDWFVRIQCSSDAAVPVASALAAREDVSWIGFTSGGTEVTCLARAPRSLDPDTLLLRKLPRAPRIASVTAQCLLRVVAGTSGWPGRTSALSAEQAEELRADGITTDIDIPFVPSETDQRLFSVLATDGRAGFPDLAAAVGTSETTVRRRLGELRRSGVLAFTVEIDPVLFGYTTEVILWLRVIPSRLAAVADALATHEEIAFAAATTGPTNIMALAVCRDMDALYDYLAQRIGSLRGVLQVETAPVVRRAKRDGTLLALAPR